MSDDRHSEEQQEPRRPRVVDKRISARPPVREAPAREAPGRPADTEAPAAEQPVATAVGKSGGTEAQEPVGTAASGPVDAATPASGQVWTPKQQEAAEKLAKQILETPAETWVLNVAMTLLDVAGVKLDGGDPAGSSLAIDALAALAGEVGPRLGEAGTALNRAVSDLRMAYAERVAASPQEPRQ